MSFLRKVIKNPNKLQRLIGLSLYQLNLLVQVLKPLWENAELERLGRPNRSRNPGGGHPYALETIEEKIIAVFLYYKQYPTQEFLGVMIGTDQSTVSRLIKKMLPLIEEAADPQLKNYLAQAKEECKKQRMGSWDEFFSRHPDLVDISTDVTEQRCYRSQNYEQQKKYYSGKSKRHTIKTQISSSRRGQILDVSVSYPGSVHDKTIIDTEKTVEKIDKRIPHRFDSGYQGIKSDYPNHYLILPVKKPRGGTLTDLEKEHNKANSKRRVKVEHGFSRIKKFRIIDNLFRQPLKLYNQTFRNVVSILNFKLQYPMLAM